MNFDGDIIRPPSEANSIILQATVGCSHNQCTFCGAYKNKKFRIRSDEEVLENIEFANHYQAHTRTLFIADGDALILSQKRLLDLFALIRKMLPKVRRISLYGNAKSIRSKTVEQLKELKSLGLGRIYMGLESGDSEILDQIQKGESPESMVEAGKQVRKAGIFLSLTVLLGLGGVKLSKRHAEETGKIVSRISPNQIAALTLMPIPATPLGESYLNGTFSLPGPQGILEELRQLLTNIYCDRVQFMANHASNYLPLTGRLQRDTVKLTNLIDQALTGKTTLRPEYVRGL